MPEDISARALITSGTSFLGLRLTEFLLDNGCQVVCHDDFSSFNSEAVRRLRSKNGFFLEAESLVSKNFFKKITQEFSSINYVFHLSLYQKRQSPEKLSQQDLKKIVEETESLLKLSAYYESKVLVISPLGVFQKKSLPESFKDFFPSTRPSDFPTLEQVFNYIEGLAAFYFQKENLNVRLVRLPELLGPGMPLSQKGEAIKILRQVARGGPIKIPGDGSRQICPLFINDAVAGLTRSIFAPRTNGEIFVFAGERISLLGFAQGARERILPGAEIEYVAERAHPEPVEGRNPPGWKPVVSPEEILGEISSWLPKESRLPVGKEEKATKEEKKEKPQGKTGGLKHLLVSFLIFLLVLFSPLAYIGVNLGLSYHFLSGAANQTSAGNFDKAEENFYRASSFLSFSQEAISLASPVFSSPSLYRIERNLFLAQMITQVGIEGTQAARASSELLRKIVLGEDVNLEGSLSSIKLSLGSFLDKASLVQGLLSSVREDDLIFGKKATLLKEKLPQVRQMGEAGQQLLALLPEILGEEGRKTYLFLFQNNMELRPTGGFIGSFGLATFEKGRLVNFEVQDVYAADGQLRGYVEPPAELKKLLGLSSWYLRDSNWDPDFPASAVRAEWFLEKEIGRSVDGVIAVDLFTLERILEQTGEIYLPDYDEKINGQNFFEKAQYHIEAGFFPGSTGKKDFLGAVATALFEKIKSLEPEATAKIATAFYSCLEGKDILVYLHQPQAASIISQLGWDGAIKEVECEKLVEGECLADYLMLVESNVGINKANYFVKRKLYHQILIDGEGRVSKKLVIDYENKSPNDIFPAGRYKNYLRLFVPRGSSLEKVEIKGGSQEKEPEVETQVKQDKTIFGFLVEVPVGEKRKVEIDYLLPKDQIVLGGARPGPAEGEYVFLWQKQSGATADEISLNLVLPKELKLLKAHPSLALTQEGFLSYNTTLSKDIIFQIKFAKR